MSHDDWRGVIWVGTSQEGEIAYSVKGLPLTYCTSKSWSRADGRVWRFGLVVWNQFNGTYICKRIKFCKRE